MGPKICSPADLLIPLLFPDDYGAAITESRELTPKYTELKRQSLFLRSVRDFASTKIVSDENEAGVAKVVQLRNPDTGAGFYIVRQTNSSSLLVVRFRPS